MNKKLKIGLALGSGAARGWAHIGIIQALEELGIKVDVIAGCSIGALVGGVHASEKLDEFSEWVQALNWREIVKYMDVSFREGGLISGKKLMSFLSENLGDTLIEKLPHKFAAVATDLDSGREIWLQEGSLFDAIRASISLPGLFRPIQYNDVWLVDGGLVNPVPVSVCRALGADIVIAVNLNANILRNYSALELKPAHSKFSIRGQVEVLEKLIFKRKRGASHSPRYFDILNNMIKIMQDRITRSRAAGDPADITLEPMVGNMEMFDFDCAEMAIKEGRLCVERSKDLILRILGDVN